MAYTDIDDPTVHFLTKLYTGTGSSNSISLGFQPDLCWIKNRGSSTATRAFDSVRGATKAIYTSTTDSEGTNSQSLTSFDSDGFTMGTHSTLNGSSSNICAWCWKGGTTSGITTNGSTTITPASYSFNATAGISIVKYAGNGTSGAKYPHGLGVTPKTVIVKNLDADGSYWNIHHASLGNNSEVYLNGTDAAPGSTSNGTTPDSVNIDLEGTGEAHNNNGANYVAYIFAEKKGFSKFGSYTGNGNADGTFVYTGFRPAFIMTKKTSSTSNWTLLDNKRLGYNADNNRIYTNLDEAANTSDVMDILSNGFKMRSTASDNNTSGATYIYWAFAESPFTNSSGVPNNAR